MDALLNRKEGNIYELLDHEVIMGVEDPFEEDIQLTYVCEECHHGWWEDPGEDCPICHTYQSVIIDMDRRHIECPLGDAPIGSEFWTPLSWERHWDMIEDHCDYLADQAEEAYERRHGTFI